MVEPGKVLLEDEVLRDGLQMESRLFSLAEKVKIFHLLKEAKVPRIQVGPLFKNLAALRRAAFSHVAPAL